MAGSWSTWVLASGSELRLAPPPKAAATQAELQVMAAQRDAAALDRVGCCWVAHRLGARPAWPPR
jgi:hypothetical protein